MSSRSANNPRNAIADNSFSVRGLRESRTSIALAALNLLQKAVAVVGADNSILYSNVRFSEIFGDSGIPREILEVLQAARAPSASLDVVRMVEYQDRKFNLRIVKLKQHWLVTADDVSERLAEQERFVEQARTDPLTHLGNRLMFRERVTEKLDGLTSPKSAAILVIDLNGFKAINDALGHGTGDAVLKIISDRIRSTLQSGEVVARLGGDEFAIYQEGQQQPQAASTLAKRLNDLLSRAYLVEGQLVNLSASIGISLAPIDGRRYDDVLRNADLAMYRAKQGGQGRFCFFDPSMREALRSRREMETLLRRALALREFHLNYQPQLNLASGRITGFEALLRWHSQSRGPVSPAQFVPLAEELGLIIPIGEWVIRQACREASSWSEPANVAVNVSAVQFQTPNLIPMVISALSESGLPPRRLELEITESVLLRDHQSALKTLNSVRELGVRVSMDDFGTGYSSLSYLGSFPFDKLKIDQSFVRGEHANESGMKIVRAMAALGQSLGMSITAEGVETPAQLAAVAEAGCTDVQGYLLSRPLPSDMVLGFLAHSSTAISAMLRTQEEG